MHKIVKSFLSWLMPNLYRKLARVNAIAGDHEWFHEVQDRREFFRRAFKVVKFNGITGDYVEFGTGGTFGLAYQESRRHLLATKLWAFDSFAGFPASSDPADYHPVWQPGAMKSSLESFIRSCDRIGIPRAEYETVVGYYDETLAQDRFDDARLPVDIAIAYIDCDMYSSTVAVLRFLESRFKHGMLIAFDDYFCYSDRTLSGERRAFLEVQTRTKFAFSPYFQFGWHGMSFIVEDRALYPPICA